MYKKVNLIREFELRINTLYQETFVYGAGHISVGEEAIAVGVCENLTNADYVVSTHRGYGNLFKTFQGILVLGIIANGMTLLNIQPYVQQVLKGTILIVVIVFDEYFRQRKNK